MIRVHSSECSFVDCRDVAQVIAYVGRFGGRAYWQRERLIMEHGRRYTIPGLSDDDRSRIVEALNQWEPFRHRADYGRAVRAWRLRVDQYFRENPDATAETRRGRWQTREQWRRECGNALDARINATVRPEFEGRKCDPDYQRRLYRDSRAVRARLTARVCVRQFETPEARARFADLLDVA